MSWKILIVEDEDPAREELTHIISSINPLFQIDQAKNGLEAIKKVKELKPDFIFLDIELPDINGLQVAEIVSDWNKQTKIIFATAYDRYAIDAFKVRAYHYLLKPYNEDEIQRLLQEMENMNPPLSSQQVQHPFKLAIDNEGGIRYLSPADIIFISKEGKHVHVHTKRHVYHAQYTLQELEEKLLTYRFFRCHKSYLINLEHIVEMRPWLHGAFNLHMDDEKQSTVPVSRNYVKELRLKLEI